jgi:hypothetical protein
MKRIGLNLRTVFHQRIKNMNRLPDTAGDEAGEQGNIGVGDVVVSDTAISTVADVRHHGANTPSAGLTSDQPDDNNPLDRFEID